MQLNGGPTVSHLEMKLTTADTTPTRLNMTKTQTSVRHKRASHRGMFRSSFTMNRHGKMYVVAMPPVAPVQHTGTSKCGRHAAGTNKACQWGTKQSCAAKERSGHRIERNSEDAG
mmetsp:Transcript_1915/g.4359  ORF Transcript_1915/g.4359 Transcript_1915/m.4359 type:complete len:115 (-) Transcript_1915:656-1000(-)